MSATYDLPVQVRTGSGKGVARKLRARAQMPAVLYGAGTQPRNLSLDTASLLQALSSDYGQRVLLHLQIEGEKGGVHAIVKEIQKHPVTRRFLHADLLAVRVDEPVIVHVPLRGTEGTPYGVKNEGGVLEWMRREVAIRVLPEKMPAAIEVDVVPLRLGQRITAAEAVADEFELVTPGDTALCHVVATRMSIETTEEAEAAEEVEGVEGEGEAPAAEEAEAAEGDKKSQD
jgi:large subunit ribosomal protein L25